MKWVQAKHTASSGHALIQRGRSPFGRQPLQVHVVDGGRGIGTFQKNPTPLWMATSSAGPVKIYFQRSRQNFEPIGCKLQRFRQQKFRVSESVPP